MLTMHVDPLKLTEALSRQADKFNKAAAGALTDGSVTINATVAMTLYALSIALSESLLSGNGAEPKPLDEILGADENVGSA